MRFAHALLITLCVAALGAGGLTACAAGEAPSGESQLTIKVRPASGQPFTWTLICEPPGGDHPTPEQACAHLASLDDPFAPLDEDLICDQRYSGPDTADITGVWQGEPVALQLSRINGCHTTQWESLRPVVPESTFGIDDQFTGRIRA